MAKVKPITNFTSAELDAHGDKVAVLAEFQRRLANAKAATHARNGKPLSTQFVQSKVARLEAKVQQYANASAPAQVAAFTEAPKSTAPSRKTKAQLQAELAEAHKLIALLAK